MEAHALVVAHTLFWIVAAFCAFAPVRWAVPAMGILAFLNLSGPSFASATTLGVENAVRIVVLPTLLLGRVGIGRIRQLSWKAFPRTYLLLASYALLASLWTPYQLSALKMMGYFYAYSAVFVLFGIAWMRNWLNPSVICALVFTGLSLAFIQTFLLGDAFSPLSHRFTAFSSAQGFAAFLVCALSILMFVPKKTLVVKVTILAALGAIILSGSRYVFAGTAALIVVASVARLFETRRRVGTAKFLRRAAVGLGLAALLFVAVGRYLPESRTAQLVEAISGEESFEDIGTFAWRLMIYAQTIRELESRNFTGLLVGSGTSSGATLLLRADPRYHEDTVDANRALHNEFLRVLYEWGFIGLFIFLSFLVTILSRAIQNALSTRSPRAFSVIGILPTLIAGLAIENLLAGVSGPSGMGFTLVLAYGFPPVLASKVPARVRHKIAVTRGQTLVAQKESKGT